MIVGLGHQAQVGKDTAAQILVDGYGFKRLAFADRLKQMAFDINPMVGTGVRYAPTHLARLVDQVGFEKAKEDPEVRRFLQNLGVAARDNLGEDVWVRVVLDQITADLRQDWVITDVRFPNEFDTLNGLGWLVKITRPGVETNAGTHVSETALADYDWDYTIRNDGTIQDLESKLVKVLGL